MINFLDPIKGFMDFFTHSCAFSGHRPNKLPWRGNETDPRCKALKAALEAQITAQIEVGCTEFLSGMALAVDTWAAEIVLKLREENPALHLHCILPCADQDAKWSASARGWYHAILEQADSIVRVSRENTKNCMLERNQFLVRYAPTLIAVYNGEPRGGTAATIRYARKLERRIIIIDPNALTVTREEPKPLED